MFIYDFILLYLQVSLGSLAADRPRQDPCAVQVAVQVSGKISLTISALNLVIVAIVNLEVAPSWCSRLSDFDAWCGDWQ